MKPLLNLSIGLSRCSIKSVGKWPDFELGRRLSQHLRQVGTDQVAARSQLFGLISTTQAACTNRTRR